MLQNDMELGYVERGWAVFEQETRRDGCNTYGVVNGGGIYTLEDNATGTAAHSDGRYYVTQTSALHFLRNQSRRTVLATAWTRQRGTSTARTSVHITSEDGKLLATAEFTIFCVDKAPMDTKVANAKQ